MVEGSTDAAVARRLIQHVGGEVLFERITHGKGKLDTWVRANARTVVHQGKWLILRDLDRDASCASELVSSLTPRRDSRLYLRIAVRSIESWILADREGVAASLGVSSILISKTPDGLELPKREIVNLARKSKFGHIKRGLVPTPDSKRVVGIEYETWLIEFVSSKWDLTGAIDTGYSPSLLKAYDRLLAAVSS